MSALHGSSAHGEALLRLHTETPSRSSQRRSWVSYGLGRANENAAFITVSPPRGLAGFRLRERVLPDTHQAAIGSAE